MIRCKITPKLVIGIEPLINIKIEWVEIGEGEIILRTLATEEFNISTSRDNCSYITRGSFELGNFLPATFWVDEKGSRHFIMMAEPGAIGLFGKECTGVEDGR